MRDKIIYASEVTVTQCSEMIDGLIEDTLVWLEGHGWDSKQDSAAFAPNTDRLLMALARARAELGELEELANRKPIEAAFVDPSEQRRARDALEATLTPEQRAFIEAAKAMKPSR